MRRFGAVDGARTIGVTDQRPVREAATSPGPPMIQVNPNFGPRRYGARSGYLRDGDDDAI